MYHVVHVLIGLFLNYVHLKLIVIKLGLMINRIWIFMILKS